MKHLLTAIACCLAVAGSAQTPVPFNPDADGDELIGVEDLMVTLSLFGQSFSPTFMSEEVFVVPFDSTAEWFSINTLSSIYLIDLRTAEFADPYYTVVDIEVFLEDANFNPIWFLNGTQFWFLSEYDDSSVNGWVTVHMSNYNTDTNEEMDCLEGVWSLEIQPQVGQTYSAMQTPFNFDCSESESWNGLPLLSRYAWLNGEMVIIR